jgi:hypothetical protein
MSLNGLVLNLDKINIIKYIMNKSPHCALRIGCKEKYVKETGNKSFFYLQTYNQLKWLNHFDQMILNLRAAFYAGRWMFHISNINTLRSIF